MFKYLLMVFIIIICSANQAFANPLDHRFQKAFSVQRLSIEEGLSQSVVNAIVQDSRGYIWVGTEDGLNKFDGYQFEIFQQKHGDKSSLHDNLIYSLLEDPEKGLWVGTQNGASYYDFATRTFTPFIESNKGKLGLVSGFALSPSGKVIVSSENGLFELESQTSVPQLIRFPSDLVIDTEVTALDFDQTYLWFATDTCFYSYDWTLQSLIKHCDPRFKSALGKNLIKTIHYRQSILWIGTSNGLFEYDLNRDDFKVYRENANQGDSLSSNWVYSIASDSNGQLWIGTDTGLNKLDLKNQTFEYFQHQIFNQDGLTSNDIFCIFIDDTNLVWLGTYAGGVNLLSSDPSSFRHILTKSDLIKLNADNTIHGIAKDREENLWFASFGSGLLKLDQMTGEYSIPFDYYKHDANRYAYSLEIDKANRLWVGTTQGLSLVDLNNQRLLNVAFELNDAPFVMNRYVFQIYEDYNGEIWIATYDGLFKVIDVVAEPLELKIKLKRFNSQIPLSYRDNSNLIQSILLSRDGNLWLGGPGGLLRFDIKQGKWSHFKYNSENSQSLSNNDVQVIFEDSRNVLWVGTSNGLNRVNRRTNNGEVFFERITKDNGLPNNAIYGVQEDNLGQLWISTNLGIVKYSDVKETMESYRAIDGLSSNEFNKGAFYTDSDGVIYFGSINGVSLIKNKSELKVRRQSRLRFREIQVGETFLDVFKLNTEALPRIVKGANDAFIKITVADLYYKMLGTQEYRYRIHELNDRWINLGKERSFVLAGLKKGAYHIEIQVRAAGKDWLDEPLRLELSVATDFWDSINGVLFVLFNAIIVILILTFVVVRYYRKRISRYENLAKLESVRIKEIKRENEELTSNLEVKRIAENSMSAKLDKVSEQLKSYDFRDSVTGFYHFDCLQRVNQEISSERTLMQNFSLIMLLDIFDYDKLRSQFGLIGSAEIRSYIALELKKVLPSRAQISVDNESRFLVFGNSIETKDLTNSLFELKRKLEISHIPVANEQSVSPVIHVSYIEVYPDKIDSLDVLTNLARLLLELNHSQTYKASSLMRVDLNRSLPYYADIESALEVLLANKAISVHVIPE